MARADVEVEGLLEEAWRGVEQGTGHGAPQVVDDDVNAAQLVLGGLGQRAHEVDIGEIAHDHNGPAPGGLDLHRHLAQLLLGPGGQDDVGTRFGQGHRGGGADATATPGDDGYLVGHAEVVEDHGPGL